MSTAFQHRFLRLAEIIGKPATGDEPAILPLVPVSKTTWYQGIKDGRFPKPCRCLGTHISVWHSDGIHALLNGQQAKEQE